MSKTEKHIEHYPNGQKRIEGTYKDWKRDGKWTFWFDNDGQKDREETYKDGKEIERTEWYYLKNGQKRYEETYKDGELISQECWDEDGNEKECD